MNKNLGSTLFEHSEDAIICVSAEGTITAWNPAAEKMFGYAADQILGSKAALLTDEVHAPQFAAMISRACQGEHVAGQELVLCTQNALPFSQEVSCLPLLAAPGEPASAIVICHDISRQKNIEKKLKDQQQQLIQSAKMAALGILVTGIAHEINNPLNLIHLHNSLFQKIWNDLKHVVAEKAVAEPGRTFGGLSCDYLIDQMDKHLTDVHQAVTRILKILEGLKNFSRKAHPQERCLVEVNTCVEHAIKLAETTIRKSSIALNLSLSDNLPKIKANQIQIEQVLLNLIINAIQAIDHNAGAITIRTSAREEDTVACIEVEDNGRGIDPALQDTIFDPFVTDKQSSGGTGLGLAIAYNLVTEHGGKIEFTSQQAHGTMFRILLPTVLHEKPVKVLIADDEISMRTSIAKALSRRSRFILETAESGYEVCIKLGTFKPDILILDLVMPEMNGLEVCKVIRAEPEFSNLQVVIMTGYVSSELLEGIRSLGFSDIITKPFKLADLVRMVEGKAEKVQR